MVETNSAILVFYKYHYYKLKIDTIKVTFLYMILLLEENDSVYALQFSGNLSRLKRNDETKGNRNGSNFWNRVYFSFSVNLKDVSYS